MPSINNTKINFKKTISEHVHNSIDTIKKIESELTDSISEAVNLVIKTFTSGRVLKNRKLGFQKKFALCKGCSLGNADFMGLNVKLK